MLCRLWPGRHNASSTPRPRSEPHSVVPCQEEPANAWSNSWSSKPMRRSIGLLGLADDVVVDGLLIEAAQELPCLGGHHRRLVVLACKRAHRLQRIEERQRHELDPLRDVPPQQESARMTLHPVDAG